MISLHFTTLQLPGRMVPPGVLRSIYFCTLALIKLSVRPPECLYVSLFDCVCLVTRLYGCIFVLYLCVWGFAFVCVFACFCLCLFTCLFGYMFVCVYVLCRFACVLCLSAYLFVCISVSSISLSVYMCVLAFIFFHSLSFSFSISIFFKNLPVM